ncbi:MAG: uL15m family ribosomal protein [Candidatus Woesearchaeota archaeon]
MKFKRKKKSRMRGSNSHGWGAKKKHRGAGHRGGRGFSGSGKRADQKKPRYWNTDYFGKKGFKLKRQESVCINLQTLETQLNGFIASGDAVEKEGTIHINLSKMGYDKLLSKGNATRKYNIIVASATENAVKKIRSLGGEVKEG